MHARGTLTSLCQGIVHLCEIAETFLGRCIIPRSITTLYVVNTHSCCIHSHVGRANTHHCGVIPIFGTDTLLGNRLLGNTLARGVFLFSSWADASKQEGVPGLAIIAIVRDGAPCFISAA